MIEIIALNTLKAGKKAEFIETAQELIRKSQKEVGCVKYDLYEELEDESIVTFIEIWADQTAITAHNQSEHFQNIVPKLAELIEGMDVKLYKKI